MVGASDEKAMPMGEKLDALFVLAASYVSVGAIACGDEAVEAAGKVAETAAHGG
jgi:hypothetical protein